MYVDTHKHTLKIQNFMLLAKHLYSRNLAKHSWSKIITMSSPNNPLGCCSLLEGDIGCVLEQRSVQSTAASDGPRGLLMMKPTLFLPLYATYQLEVIKMLWGKSAICDTVSLLHWFLCLRRT